MEKKNKESRRHHYIPQFILRNFSNDKDTLNYFDVKNTKETNPYISNSFMNIDMNRDVENHPDNPTEIEKLLSKLESDVSLVFKKFLAGKKIIISRSELELLHIYCTVQSFRDDYRKKQYENKMFDELTIMALSPYVKNNDYLDLWKRELEAMAKCRGFKDIQNSDVIDPVIKLDFANDLSGTYLSILEARGEDFLIGDVFPTTETYKLNDKGLRINLHYIFPISHDRVLIMNNSSFDKNLKEHSLIQHLVNISRINGNLVKKPNVKYSVCNGVYDSNDQFTYTVANVYESDVIYINGLILNEARIGIAYKDKFKVIKSIEKYSETNKEKYKGIMGD